MVRAQGAGMNDNAPDWDAVRWRFRYSLSFILKRPVETLPLIVDHEHNGLPAGDPRRMRQRSKFEREDVA